MAFSSESGHWYERDGTPAYTVPNKSKGGMRPTRITDAKKLDLVPSVTTVIRVLAAPALTNWLVETNLLALATLPKIKGETIDARIVRAKRDAKEQVIKAAEMGTEIHGAIERFFSGDVVPHELTKYVEKMTSTFEEERATTLEKEVQKLNHELTVQAVLNKQHKKETKPYIVMRFFRFNDINRDDGWAEVDRYATAEEARKIRNDILRKLHSIGSDEEVTIHIEVL